MAARSSTVFALALALAAGCSKSDKKPATGKAEATGSAEGSGLGASAGLSAVAGKAGLELPVKDVAGPSITPVATSSITFVVPKADVTWTEFSYACYGAAATMSGDGGSPGAPIAAVSPVIPIVMEKAQIDLDKDLTAMGGFACGDGPCIYLAAHLEAPEKMKDGLEAIPGISVVDHGGGHYSFGAPGASGARTIHVRVVPVKWAGGKVADDPWNAAQLRTTHVVFLGGVTGEADVDPLTLVLEPKEAAAKVAATESVAEVSRGRCAVGVVGRQEAIKPGFDLERARFAMAAPLGDGDPLTREMGSKRSLDLEIELTMKPAPTKADLARWTDEAKESISATVTPLRAQFAGQGPMVDMIFEMGQVLVEHGFRPTITGQDLRLSWRTDRVPASALAELERKFQSVLGTP